MATTMTSAKDDLAQLRQEASQAATAREQAHAALTATQARVARYRAILDPNVGGQMNQPTRSVEELLLARAELPAADVMLAQQQLAALRADKRDEAARAAIKAAADAEIHQLERVAFTEVTKILLRARPAVDRWLALQERRQNEVGRVLDPIASRLVNALATGTPTSPALFDVWVQAGKERGLLDSTN